MTMADATVLVVDDEPELLEIFSIWLKRYGTAVMRASNGAEALEILRSHKIDVLISDMRMPVMDGVTLVRSLHDLNLSLPTIIFVSGFGDVSNRILYSLGVEAMLSKPLGRQQLLSTLQGSLRELDERWFGAAPEPAAQTLSIDFPSLEKAIDLHSFELGRGGCRLRLPPGAPETLDTPVGLRLSFAQDGTTLTGQGLIRWYDPPTRHAGIEFVYLDPTLSAWVLDRIRSAALQSFIPA